MVTLTSSLPMEPVTAYRRLWREVLRLPLPQKTLSRIRAIMRRRFEVLNRMSTSKYRAATTFARDILHREQWELLPKAWDVAYKEKPAEWLVEFSKLNHRQLSSVWPQVHLIEQISTDERHLIPYRSSLQESKCGLPTVSHMSSSSKIKSPPMLREHSTSSTLSVSLLFETASRYFSFLARHQSLLSIDGCLQIEAVYPTTRDALPVHPAIQNKILREKVAQVKSLLMQFRPIHHTLYDEVVSVATDRPPTPINPNFYRFMHRKRLKEIDSISPHALATLRPKKFVPTPHDISRHMRAYLMKQVWELDDGSLAVSPVQNLHHNQTSMWKAIRERVDARC